MSKNEIQEAAKEPMTLKHMLNTESMKKQFALALPKHVSVDRFLRVATSIIPKVPNLADCTPESFMGCMLDLAAMGIEPDGRKAHLIPFNNKRMNRVECTLIVDYKGLVEMVRRDPNVVDVQCYTVREKDSCKFVNGQLLHEYNPMQERGNVIGVYTMIQWKNGHKSFGEVMSREEANKVRNTSKSKDSGPWSTHFEEMWKKSAIRRDSKMWPLAAEVGDAIAKMDEHEHEFEKRNMRNVTSGEQMHVESLTGGSQAIEERKTTTEKLADMPDLYDNDGGEEGK